MASIANVVSVSGSVVTIVPTAGAVVGSGNITNATAAVVTIDNHGIATGDYVSFSAILQANWTALNGNAYKVTKLTASTFSIPVDTTLFGAYTDASGVAWHDYDFAAYFPNGLRVSAIDFVASNAADYFVLKVDSGSGKIFCKMVGTRTLAWTDSLSVRSLFFDNSASSFNTAADALAIIYLAS